MKAARSFIAVFIGWAAAFITHILRQVYDGSGFGYVADFGFYLFWPALFALTGWVVFGLPIVYLLPERIASRWYACTVTGTVICVLAYLLLVCTWATELIDLIWFPAIIGAVGGFTYSILGRVSFLDRFRRAAIPAMFLAPGIAVAAFAFLIWPAALRVTPYLGYRFGDSKTRSQAEYEIVSRIKPGDTFAELHRQYPALFGEPFLSIDYQGMADGSVVSYQIYFDETRTYVTKIDVNLPTK